MYFVHLTMGYDGVERYAPDCFCVEGELTLDKLSRIHEYILEIFADVKTIPEEWIQDLQRAIDLFKEKDLHEYHIDNWGDEEGLLIKVRIWDLDAVDKV